MHTVGKALSRVNWFGAVTRIFFGPKILWFYTSLAIPGCLFLAIATPPFQTPDAPNHFFRVYQISQGTLFGKHVKTEDGADISGGYIDSGLIAFSSLVQPIRFARDQRWTRSQESTAVNAKLSGVKIPTPFSNTAPYPFLDYLPQAISFWVFGHGNASLLRIYRASCVINAMFGVVLTVLALSIARRSRALIFTLALLPESLSLMASVSLDGTLIPLAFLLIALLDRISLTREVVSNKVLGGLAFLIVATAIGRIPYVVFVLAFLHPAIPFKSTGNGYGLSRRLPWLIGSFIAISSIYFLQTRIATGGLLQASTMSVQAKYLAGHWSLIPSIMTQTFISWGVFYVYSFVGILGWLDTLFDIMYYKIAISAICISVLFCALQARSESATARSGLAALLYLVPMLAGATLIFLGLYLQWSAVGSPKVDGVQGRYFLPLFPLLALAIPPFTDRLLASRAWYVWLQGVLVLCLLGFPIVSFYKVIGVILDRYYIF